MAEKNTYLLNNKWNKMLLALNDEQLGCLMRCIVSYQEGIEIAPTDPTLGAIWIMIEDYMFECQCAYDATCARRKEAGAKGGLAKASKAKQVLDDANDCLANLADNDSDIDNDKDSNKKEKDKKEKVTKHKYGQYNNVLFTDEDYQKLQDEFPKDYKDRIEKLSEYMASTGKSYKSHLATIRSWSRKDKPEPVKKQNQFTNHEQRSFDQYADFIAKLEGG